MKISRQNALAGAAAITVTLTIWTAWRDAREPADVAQPLVRAPKSRTIQQRVLGVPSKTGMTVSSHRADSESWARDPLVESDIDPFKVVSFLPPPPKVAETPPPPPPKPTAPPFPYRYFGRMADVEGRLVTYLTRDKALIPVHEKEILDNLYRVDSVTESQIVVTYVPLEEKTVITMSPAAE